jgi:hypothetical protein
VQNLAKIDIDDSSEWYEVPVHTVTVVDRQRGVTHRFPVPEDQYVLHTAEDQQISLPFSCRHGWIPECLLSELGQDFFGVYVAEEVITTKSFFSEVSKVYCTHVVQLLSCLQYP